MSFSHPFRDSYVRCRFLSLARAGSENSPLAVPRSPMSLPVIPPTKVPPPVWASAPPAEIFRGPTYCSLIGWAFGYIGARMVMGSLPAAVSLPRFQLDSIRCLCTSILLQNVTTTPADSAWSCLFLRDLCPWAPCQAAVVEEMQTLSNVWCDVSLVVLTVSVLGVCVWATFGYCSGVSPSLV